MKIISFLVSILLTIATPALANVAVSSPANGATVSSPVHYVATATTTTCSKGVASMGIYVNNHLTYVVNSTSMNTELTLAPGFEHTVVQEWDHCGGSTYTTINLTVGTATAPTVSLTASPASIASGGSSTLSVSATNATSVVITGSNGSSYTLPSGGGTQVVSPTATTTYTAQASSSAGSATASATVTVGTSTAPTVTLTASPASIASGGSSTLSVTATNATSVVVTGSNGSSYSLPSGGGTQVVSPTATTTYTAKASSSVGNATASATVTVGTSSPGVTVTSPVPNSTVSSPVNYVATASTNTCSAGVASMGVYVNNKLIYVVNGTSMNTEITLASGPEHTVVQEWDRCGGSLYTTVNLTVQTSAMPTVTLIANPASITPGSTSTLSVTATNATQVLVKGSDGSSYTLPATGGTQAVSPAATTTYTAQASSSAGNATASATVTVGTSTTPTVTLVANPTSITAGSSSTLTVTATNSTQVVVSGTDGSSYNLAATGGTVSVTPTVTTTYTAEATGSTGHASASATVTVGPQSGLQSVQHVIFMLQENHTFDNYFGMLNPYREGNGWNIGDDGKTYNVDGIDDKLSTISNQDDQGQSYGLFKFKTTCIDDDSSAWLESYGDVNRYHFLASRLINMDGFVHIAEGFADSCAKSGTCSGAFTDLTGERAMGYYDEGFLNYYYYMASQFALSDRWFSPISSKSVDNRIATFTGGTTQGLVNDPQNDDHLPQLGIDNIFQELDGANVSWKIYYTVTDGFCVAGGPCSSSPYPATYFVTLSYSYKYLYQNPNHAACNAPTQPSSVVGDSSNSFCIDPTHIAPLSQYYSDLTNGTLPSFAFIESGSGLNDEHPGSGQPILSGQAEVAKVMNAFMGSPEWMSSVFFFSYDEGGGPYDHVPPVPGHSNQNTDASLGTIPDISQIAVSPDSYIPCLPPTPGTATLHCDLTTNDPGANPQDAAAEQGFAAQLGFRVPNMIVSPFSRRHYVSHTPMDHTAVIKFVENRFIGPSAHLTARDAAQPNLLEFFDFNAIPWATPPTPPTPASVGSSCTPASMGP